MTNFDNLPDAEKVEKDDLTENELRFDDLDENEFFPIVIRIFNEKYLTNIS